MISPSIGLISVVCAGRCRSAGPQRDQRVALSLHAAMSGARSGFLSTLEFEQVLTVSIAIEQRVECRHADLDRTFLASVDADVVPARAGAHQRSRIALPPRSAGEPVPRGERRTAAVPHRAPNFHPVGDSFRSGDRPSFGRRRKLPRLAEATVRGLAAWDAGTRSRSRVCQRGTGRHRPLDVPSSRRAQGRAGCEWRAPSRGHIPRLREPDDLSIAVQKIERRPSSIVPCAPGLELVVLGDGVADVKLADGALDIWTDAFESELGRVDADDLQALGPILRMPAVHVG